MSKVQSSIDNSTGLAPIVLVAGTFCYPEVWDAMKAELEQRGYEVHAPPLRHHDLPLLEGALAMAETSLQDYVDDFVGLITTLERPPIIIGWSLGGLLAQLIAQRVEHAAMILLSPAPAAGMFAAYPSMIKTFQHHFSRWGFWRKPLMPEWESFVWSIGQLQSESLMRETFVKLKAESGKAYFEMAMWFLDKKRASKVFPERITGPVLVIAGDSDRIVRTPISRRTAARYADSKFVELGAMDHMLVAGTGLPRVMKEFDIWAAEKGL
ncbi:MAG: alpha/beta hydrolase [Oleibacter sp.]|nr:alpha/beta hydrolase [Thalassolituus sp.]